MVIANKSKVEIGLLQTGRYVILRRAAVVNPAPTLVPCVRYLMGFCCNDEENQHEGKLSCSTKMLDPTTETKRGNFGSIPPTYTMLGPTPLYLCVGWAWDHGFEMCESTSYIITRVDATSFRSLFLILSTLVVLQANLNQSNNHPFLFE